MGTARAAKPTYTATWHPNNGPVETLARGSAGQTYLACVRALPKELQSVTASNPGRRIGHRHPAAGHQIGTIQSRVRRLLGDFIEQTSNA